MTSARQMHLHCYPGLSGQHDTARHKRAELTALTLFTVGLPAKFGIEML